MANRTWILSRVLVVEFFFLRFARFKELTETNSKGILTEWYALRAMLFELCHLSRIIEFFRRLRYCAESFRLTDSTEQTRNSFFLLW